MVVLKLSTSSITLRIQNSLLSFRYTKNKSVFLRICAQTPLSPFQLHNPYVRKLSATEIIQWKQIFYLLSFRDMQKKQCIRPLAAKAQRPILKANNNTLTKYQPDPASCSKNPSWEKRSPILKKDPFFYHWLQRCPANQQI